MASQGPLNPGGASNETSIGSQGWANANFNYIQTQNGQACYSMEWAATVAIYEHSIRLYYGSTVRGNNKSTGANANVGGYQTWGGASDLWGLTPTVSDINGSDFGAVLSYIDSPAAYITYYLRSSSHGFSVPTAATIDGIKVEAYTSTWKNFSWVAVSVDHVRITVYYTEAASGGRTPSRPLRQVRYASLVRR